MGLPLRALSSLGGEYWLHFGYQNHEATEVAGLGEVPGRSGGVPSICVTGSAGPRVDDERHRGGSRGGQTDV